MDAMAFIARLIVSHSLYPLGITLWLGFLGVYLWKRNPRSRTGPFLISTGLLLLLVFSLPITGWLLLWGLESKAGPYASPQELEDKGIKNIVVLSGSRRTGPRPVTDRLNCASVARTLEGLRLWKKKPEASLHLSGGSMLKKNSVAQAMADFSRFSGVPDNALVLEAESWNTEDQAELLKERLGKKPFALITSASHMPRSLALFKKQGLNPVPCPTDFNTVDLDFGVERFIPGAKGLSMSQKALHEYMGLAWLWLKDFWEDEKAENLADNT
jgi:uncharacterized SAM-binding protein YcdF (DUF218 family)